MQWPADRILANFCGSSILNKHYKDLLTKKLTFEDPNLRNGIGNLERIIEIAVQDFENVIKRDYDVMEEAGRPTSVFIQGLQDDAVKGFSDEHVRISTRVPVHSLPRNDTDKRAAKK